MHELSLAQGLIEAVRDKWSGNVEEEIRTVKVRLGEFAGVDKESLSLGFELSRKGTFLEKASLIVEAIPGICRCRGCGTEFEAGRYVTICPLCRESRVEVVSGNELDLFEIETEGIKK